ncbi:hypothetical protein ABG067_004106 [Albugo candida]
MFDRKLVAVPVVKDLKLCGLFTEHDYCQALQTNKLSAIVGDVSTPAPHASVVHPEDGVGHCLQEMTRKNATSVAVVDNSGNYLGTLSLSHISEEYFAHKDGAHKSLEFAESSVFPEMDHVELEKENLYEQLKQDMEQTRHNLKEKSVFAQELEKIERDIAEQEFSASSVYPDLNRVEDKVLASMKSEESYFHEEKRDSVDEIVQMKAEWLEEKHIFSEPADFPEVAVVSDVLETSKV